MTKYRIKGKTCSFNLKIPNYVDDNTKTILTGIFGYCLDEESKEKVLEAIDTLITQTNGLIKSLKDSKKYDKEVEQGIREFVGLHLKHGYDIGTYYTPGEDGPELIDVVGDQFDYNKIVSNLKGSKKSISEVIFYCLDLSRLAFETGLMLAYYLSEELVEQHQTEIKKAISYIG